MFQFKTPNSKVILGRLLKDVENNQDILERYWKYLSLFTTLEETKKVQCHDISQAERLGIKLFITGALGLLLRSYLL